MHFTRMKNVVKMTAFVGVLSVAGFGLAGCAAPEDSSDPDAPVNLTFVRPGSQEQIEAIFTPLLEQFEADHPNVTVTPTYMGFDELFQRMPLAAATGTLPDVFLSPGQLFPALASSGALLPLDEAIPEDLRTEIADGLWDAATWDGKVQGVPGVLGPLALWYNADIFTAAGLDPENPPATWDELEAAAQAITDNTDADGIGIYGFKRNDVTDEFAAFVGSNSATSYWDTEKQQLDLSNPALEEALSFMTGLVEKGLTEPSVDAISSDDGRALLRDGKIGMLVSSPPTLGVVGDDPKFRTAPMPAGPSGDYSSVANIDSWVIGGNTEHAELAQELAWFLSSPDSVTAIAAGYGTIPVLQSLQSADTYTEGIWPTFIDALNGTIYPAKPTTPKTDLAQDQIPGMVQSALIGTATPQEALDKIATLYGWKAN